MKSNRLSGCLLLLFLFVAPSMWGWDFQGSVSLLRYTILGNNEVEVSGTEMWEATATKITIPSEVTYENKEYTVVSIGKGAFKGYIYLEYVEFPETIRKIEAQAFQNCECLAEFNTLRLPQSLEMIGANAFQNCTLFYKIIFPENLKSIGDRAFQGCGNLNDISLPESLQTIGDYAFQSCGIQSIPLPNSLTSIGAYAFSKCSKVTALEIPKSVDKIGDNAFENCTSLKSVVVNRENPLSINLDCFSSSAYKNAVLHIPGDSWKRYTNSNWNQFDHFDQEGQPANVLVDVYTYRCFPQDGEAYVIPPYNNSYKNLSSVTIPTRVAVDGKFCNVIGVADNAFNKCQMTRLNLANTIRSIGKYAFEGCEIKVLELPEVLEEIGEGAFKGCSNMESVTIPGKLTRVGVSAFENCRSLKRVDISDLSAWCKIPWYSAETNPLYYAKHIYLNKEEIIDLVIPEGLGRGIGDYAFNNATSIRSVKFPLEGLTDSRSQIGSHAFANTAITELSVPDQIFVFYTNSIDGCVNLTSLTFEDSTNELQIVTGYDKYTLFDVYGLYNLNTLNIGRPLHPSNRIPVGLLLENVNLNGHIKVIPQNFFYGCTTLKRIIIPSSIYTIEQSAFASSGLKFIAIGSGIKNIEANAFYGCSPTTIAITSVDPPVTSNSAFSDTSGALYVTNGSQESYYNNPNCWYKFNYPNALDKPRGLNISYETDANGVIKLNAQIGPEDCDLPYITWSSQMPAVLNVNINGTVNYATWYSNFDPYKVYATTLYADGPEGSVTIKNNKVIAINDTPTDDGGNDGENGIEGIYADSKGLYRVYTITGLNVLNTKDENEIYNLAPGLYIINGKKIRLAR